MAGRLLLKTDNGLSLIADAGSAGTSPDDGSPATPANPGNICGTCGGRSCYISWNTRSWNTRSPTPILCAAGLWAWFVLGQGPCAPGGADTGADAAVRIS